MFNANFYHENETPILIKKKEYQNCYMIKYDHRRRRNE